MGAALYTECTDGCGEDGDDEINDGFPVYFHILLLILMFNNILINLKKGQDEQVPVHDGVSFYSWKPLVVRFLDLCVRVLI